MRQRRLSDAADVLLVLHETGSLGLSGLALQRQLDLDRERLEAALQELWSQGLIKEITYSKPNTWALRGGFTPVRAITRRWRLTTQGRKVMADA